jgi:predicted O-methyltransferase YrrM
MILSEEEVWEQVNRIPGSFSRLNVEKFYHYALESPGIMAEVGVDQGRSATVLLLAARHTGATVILVDAWPSVLFENMAKVQSRLTAEFADVNWMIYNLYSVEAAKIVNASLSFVHIDANHYDEEPAKDCAVWLPKLKSGGIACFHDYQAGHNMFPAVDVAVDKHTAGWEDLGAWEGLGIRRKP